MAAGLQELTHGATKLDLVPGPLALHFGHEATELEPKNSSWEEKNLGWNPVVRAAVSEVLNVLDAFPFLLTLLG